MLASFLLASALSVATPEAPPPLPRLGLISVDELPSGGGCYFAPRKPARTLGYLLVLADWKGTSLVKVVGNPERVLLTLVDVIERNHDDNHPTVGDIRTEFWRGPGFQVTLELRTIFACAPADSACEVERFSGSLIVSNPTGAYSLPIRGECGF